MIIGLQFFGTEMSHPAFFVIGIKRPLVKLSGTTDKNVYIKFGGKTHDYEYLTLNGY